MLIVLLILVPLASILAIESSIMISSRVNDVRSAQQYSGLLVIPFAALYVLGEIRSFTFSVVNLLIIAVVLIFIDFTFFFLSTKIFNREEILTKWK
jgi:hypothetical protein